MCVFWGGEGRGRVWESLHFGVLGGPTSFESLNLCGGGLEKVQELPLRIFDPKRPGSEKEVHLDKRRAPVLVQNEGEHFPFLVFTGGSLLWMDEILHHFDSIAYQYLLVFSGEPGLLRWCRISSIHS